MPSEPIVQIGVLAADPLRSVGLLAILEDVPGIEAFAVEFDGLYTRNDLAVAIVDSRATTEGLIETIGRMRRDNPALKVIAMGEAVDPARVQAVIGAGAKGYLAETAGEKEIRMAVEVVLDGSVWAPRKVLARLIDSGGVHGSGIAAEGTTGAGSIAHRMTPREAEVLKLLMDGKSNRGIAASMSIDEVTVKAHLGRMLRKTGASNRVELTLRALDEIGSRK